MGLIKSRLLQQLLNIVVALVKLVTLVESSLQL